MTTSSVRDYFEEGIAKLGLEVTESNLKQLEEYQRYLEKWNKRINLTAHRDERDSIEKNFLDSMFLSQYVREKRILDFGSGAGFPGVVLAILHSQSHVFLLEADQKKSSFLKTLLLSLSLQNAEVMNLYFDIEKPDVNYILPQELDLIVSRATISPHNLMKFSSSYLIQDGRLALMLSEKQMREFQKEDMDGFKIDLEIKYILPWSKTDRHLLFLRKNEK